MSDRFTARKLTKEKRLHQTCKVYEVKVDKSKLTNNALNHFNSLFTEAKWFYNYCLSQEDINKSNTKLKSVPVKVEDTFFERIFSVLTAQMKQSVKTRIFTNLASLKALKENGHKVGRLKFKSKINSIPLVQNNKTFFIDKANNRIGIQGWKPWIKVVGLHQIPDEAEIANATLVRKAGDFFIKITTYVNKVERVMPNTSIGIDFGCQTQLTLSNGTKIEFQVPASNRLRKLDRRIMRRGKKAKSNNKYKDQIKRQKEYVKITNKKKDIKNKVVSLITNTFKFVCFQDESIKAWHHGNHGKSIQNSGIGGIMSDLKKKSHTPLEVNKFFPSTQICPTCGIKNKIPLEQRVYTCQCGYTNDRDVKSAICIKTEAMKNIPMDYREITLGETSTSTFHVALSKINGIMIKQVGS